MKFKLEIDCDNAAFHDDAAELNPVMDFVRAGEVWRILRDLGAKLKYSNGPYPLYDINGNRVGEARFEEE